MELKRPENAEWLSAAIETDNGCLFAGFEEWSWWRVLESQLHSKQSSIVKTVKVLTHSINDKHSNEETIHRICELKIMNR